MGNNDWKDSDYISPWDSTARYTISSMPNDEERRHCMSVFKVVPITNPIQKLYYRLKIKIRKWLGK